MKALYDHVPSILEAVGNGSYRYRWGIREVLDEIDGESLTQWECDEVIVWPRLTSNKIVEAVISELWGQNYEQKLINEYNSAVLGLYSDEVAEIKVAAYKSFLEQRAEIKRMVDDDCQKLGIR